MRDSRGERARGLNRRARSESARGSVEQRGRDREIQCERGGEKAKRHEVRLRGEGARERERERERERTIEATAM